MWFELGSNDDVQLRNVRVTVPTIALTTFFALTVEIIRNDEKKIVLFDSDEYNLYLLYFSGAKKTLSDFDLLAKKEHVHSVVLPLPAFGLFRHTFHFKKSFGIRLRVNMKFSDSIEVHPVYRVTKEENPTEFVDDDFSLVSWFFKQDETKNVNENRHESDLTSMDFNSICRECDSNFFRNAGEKYDFKGCFVRHFDVKGENAYFPKQLDLLIDGLTHNTFVRDQLVNVANVNRHMTGNVILDMYFVPITQTLDDDESSSVDKIVFKFIFDKSPLVLNNKYYWIVTMVF